MATPPLFHNSIQNIMPDYALSKYLLCSTLCARLCTDHARRRLCIGFCGSWAAAGETPFSSPLCLFLQFGSALLLALAVLAHWSPVCCCFLFWCSRWAWRCKFPLAADNLQLLCTASSGPSGAKAMRKIMHGLCTAQTLHRLLWLLGRCW